MYSDQGWLIHQSELELKVNSEEKAGSQSVKVEIWKGRIFEALRAKGLSWEARIQRSHETCGKWHSLDYYLPVVLYLKMVYLAVLQPLNGLRCFAIGRVIGCSRTVRFYWVLGPVRQHCSILDRVGGGIMCTKRVAQCLSHNTNSGTLIILRTNIIGETSRSRKPPSFRALVSGHPARSWRAQCWVLHAWCPKGFPRRRICNSGKPTVIFF